MLISGFPAGPFATNCWVLATGPGSECLIVDPGMESVDGVAELVARHRLKPVAVLVTHGHLDHTFSVVPVCRTHAVPAVIHPDDRERLSDPMRFVGPQMVAILEQVSGSPELVEPDEVLEATDGMALSLAGIDIGVRHAPGHTPGSIVFHVPQEQVLLSGDVLFQQGIGRTDLPGGDPAAMARSLRDVILSFDDDTTVLPGHGQTTTIGAERRSSPYLAAALRGTL